MSRWVFDIETDGLLNNCTRMWILAAYNLDTKKMFYWLEGDLSWKEVFDKATLIVGHNIISFDIAVLKKLFDYEFPLSCKIRDTLIMSQILNYKRFDGKHSLEAWGESLNEPKGDFSDWSKYSEEMLKYCLQDVKVSVKVYERLEKELKFSKSNLKKDEYEKLRNYLIAEHYVSKWCASAALHGWPFNVEKAKALFKTLEKEMLSITDQLESKLGSKTIAIDKKKGEYYTRFPKWTKQGFYDAHTANYFGIDPCSGFEGEERMIEGEYSRVAFEPLKLSSSDDVKTFLLRNNWVPTEFNYKTEVVTRTVWDKKLGDFVEVERTVKTPTSPKITEDSLELLGGDGKLYLEYLTARSRYGILKTWLEVVDKDNRVHGDCMTIGTPSMRARHSIIVNVPSTDSKWGPEIRELFECLDGWSFIGADSAGNQARGLAHYLEDEEFTNTLLTGDIHTYNAIKAIEVLNSMGVKHDFDPKSFRPKAKRILYAFLFGASGSKLWSYIFGNLDKTNGDKFKTGFTKAVPGFEQLISRLEDVFGSTKKASKNGGYIYSLAHNKIYVDSFHKLLVYLLQATEKITCASAVMLTMKGLEAKKIPYIPLIFYHDEIDFMVPSQYAKEAAEIAKNSFRDGPKIFGVEIMDGESKIGKNWKECH